MRPKRRICCKHTFFHEDCGEQITLDSDILEELACTSKIDCEDEGTELSTSLLSLIRNLPKQISIEECEIYWNIIQLLAKFVGIEDYETTLFSSWVLRTILSHTSRVLDKMNQNDYKIFMLWLYEEINLLTENPDMTREDFFEIMEKIFYEALAEVVAGKGLSMPQKFFCKFFCEEEMDCATELTFTTCDKHNLETKSNDNSILGEESVNSCIIKPTNSYFESILYAVIDATYEIFGKELNFELIKTSSAEKENNINYVLPYHYRKPKKFKKAEPKTAPPVEAKLKKRKPSAKKVKATSSLFIAAEKSTCFEKHNYFQPLFEATEANEALHPGATSDGQLNSK